MANNQNTIKPGMNSESKAKFFAQYWGQPLIKYPNHTIYSIVDDNVLNETNNNLKHASLELTSLSDITDEDAIAITNICYPLTENWSPSMQNVANGHSIINMTFYSDEDSFSVFGFNDPFGKLMAVIDYLRSKGYALPWLDYSVEDLVSAGWVKLKGADNGK